jgi:hypothetical protein
VRLHFRRGRQRAPVASGEAPVVLGLGRDLLLDRVGDGIRMEIEDQRACFPTLVRHIETHFIDAPPALFEDSLGGSHNA